MHTSKLIIAPQKVATEHRAWEYRFLNCKQFILKMPFWWFICNSNKKAMNKNLGIPMVESPLLEVITKIEALIHIHSCLYTRAIF